VSVIDIAAVGDAPDLAAVRTLLRRYAAALPFQLEDLDCELARLPAPFCPPGGALLLARRDAEPVAVVGVRQLAEDVAEIKRLYVVPEARGLGIGRILLTRALAAARQIGYDRIRLDSHRPSMAAAIALYRRLGFIEIPPYGPDHQGEMVFFEKALG